MVMDSLDKEFVPYAQALELKELNFDEPCIGFFKENYNVKAVDQHWGSFISGISKKGGYRIDDLVLAPTFSQAFRWFREQHGLRYKFEPSKQDTVDIFIWYHVGWSYFKNIKEEEAELACLEKLIEVVKLST